MIIKLTTIADADTGVKSHELWINTNAITDWVRVPGGSRLFLTTGGSPIAVTIDPDELAAAIDPDGFCLDGGPSMCGYQDYLGARRDDESSDLSHAGYHAADDACRRHMKSCKSDRVCSVCTDHERRMRA